MDDERDVELGQDPEGNATHTYKLVPQRHARLERELVGEGGIFSSLESIGEVATGGSAAKGFGQLTDFLGDRVYDVLKVFIPDLMPRHEFNGYASKEAAERGEYHEDQDRSPSLPQINAALSAAIDVNGLKWIGRLKDFFDMDLIRGQMNLSLARWAAQQAGQTATTPSGSTPSPSLPQDNGGSAPTSSGIGVRTQPPASAPDTASASLSPGSAD